MSGLAGPGGGSDGGEAPTGSEREHGRERPERIVDRVDYDPDHDDSRPVICEVCGAEMYYTAACKLKCTRCGYMRDCSDP